jgi:gliding motility-associated-like protein
LIGYRNLYQYFIKPASLHQRTAFYSITFLLNGVPTATCWIVLLCCICCLPVQAQDCPRNIDFETGSFEGWRCYVGHVASVNGTNVISLNPSGGPVGDQHAMLQSFPGNGLDPYGNFPVNCPNGSGHSIKLGNTSGGNEAEGVAYEFTIPANKDVYSLIYHYAVVFQDPNHQESEQPRMEVEIRNITDNVRIDCSSFTFYPYGSPLPGFQLSGTPGTNTPVWYKDWSAVSINLDNMAGKTIQLFFKTADCTFRRHFGYAYVDVNSECSGEFTGAAYCPDDTAVNVVAPYGYQGYKWFNSTLSTVIGTAQTLTLSPPPPPGTKIAVELVPYNGYGCLDTLFAKLVDTLTVNAYAGADGRSCNHEKVQIGLPPRPGIVYSWTPTRGLSNPYISNPLASPDVNTAYVLKASSSGGGCATFDTVFIRADIVNDSIQVLGKKAYCITSEDSAVLVVQPTYTIQWYKDNVPLINTNQNVYQVQQSGSYYAFLSSLEGCSVNTKPEKITIESPRPGISYPDKFTLENAPLTLRARNFGVRYLWNPAVSLDKDSVAAPQFIGSADKVYNVDITTASGCVTTDTQFVKIINSIEVFVPSGFTPNKDGKNDVLRPLLRGLKDLRYFKIFNRWGQQLFQTNSEYGGWNGLVNGHAVETQTVVWVVEAVGVDDKVYKKSGTTVLIR